MEEGFPSSRENPRSGGYPAGDRPSRPQSSSSSAAADMAPAAPPVRPTPPILDRFRAMLREREEELREATGEDRPPPPTAGEMVRLYEEVLAELTFNSKPVITELTIIAGQQLQFAEGIADAICARVLEVPVDQKLPSLYLLDSIVKNIGSEYVRHFAARLSKVFCEAYNQVHPSQYSAMRHLFGTWWQVFPASVLHKIEDELQFSPSESRRSSGTANARYSKSPSPRPSHGIHVNPKYLEARRRFEHSAAEVQNARVSSSLQVYGQKSSTQFGEYDFDHPGVLTPRHVMARASSPRTAATRTTSVVGAEGSSAYSKSKISRTSSPPRIGLRRSISPPGDRYTRDASPRRVVERASPSHPGYGYAPGRLIDHNGWLERSWPSDDCTQQLEVSMSHKFCNGYGRQRSRELIDAYGNHRGKGSSHEKLPKVQRLDVNGVSSEAATRKWKNSEEEEYDWEDMSPTLADRSTRNSLAPYEPSTGNLSIRAGLTRPNVSLLESDFGRRNWPGQSPLPATEDPTFIAEDRILVHGSGHGLLDRRYLDGMGSRHESLPHYQGSRHSREPGILPYMLPQSSQQSLSPRSRGRSPQMPFAVSGMTPSIGQKLHSPYVSSSDVEMPFRRLSSVPSDPLNVDSSTREKHLTQRPQSPPLDPVMWPAVHKSQTPPLLPIPPNQKQFKSSYDFMEPNKTVANRGTNPSLFLPQQQNDAADKKTSDSNKLPQLPYQQPGLAHLKQQRQEPGSLFRLHSQEARGSFLPAATQFASHSAIPPINHVQSIGHGLSMPSILPNPLPVVPSSVAVHSMPATSLNMHGGVLPPLPPGPPPASLQMGPTSQNTGSTISGSPASAFSGLISTLMAQGLISLAPSAQSQGSVGVDFNPELLKVRYESAINALYSDLPRQCTTCGLRFKCQEEHSSHMDWHVTKNRISKNRKQKPSRKWFVSAKEWLSGAETLGNDVVPGFLPTESVPEKKEDTEMAVPADENQNVCALCGEPFEDFYSDEAEEWMYRGAVYMNAPDGYVEGLDRSQLGPIVHAKCRSESTDGSGQA